MVTIPIEVNKNQFNYIESLAQNNGVTIEQYAGNLVDKGLHVEQTESRLSNFLSQRSPDGEVYIEEGEYDEESGTYENEGYADTYQIGDRRIAVIE